MSFDRHARLLLQSVTIMSTKISSPSNIANLEENLDYKFTDNALLERAVTHRSWAHEQVGSGESQEARRLHNEAFEFVGDAVLGFIVAEYLLQNHGDLSEGGLSRMKHQLVSTKTLAAAANRIELGKHLRFGVGEEKTGGRRKQALLADAFEAVLAAIHLDGGIEPARNFVLTALQDELEKSDPEVAAAADFKTMLQERLQAEVGAAPQYEVVETVGPAHRRKFYVEAQWEGGSARGEGGSIKAAEMKAAQLALEQLDRQATATNGDDNAKVAQTATD